MAGTTESARLALSASAGPSGEAEAFDHNRRLRQRAVGFEQDAEHDIELLRIDVDARWRAPAIGNPRAQSIDLALRQLRVLRAVGAPSVAESLSVVPVAICRCGSRLSSNWAT